MRTYRNQFGADYAVPVEIEALVRAGKLRDASWGNDACPSFEVGDGSVRLWVEHPEPRLRETGGKRFAVCLCDENGEFLGTGVETDRLDEVLGYLADHFDITCEEV